MLLKQDNYHGLKANKEFWSVSQFKTFKDCEAKGLAEVKGDYTRPTTEALLMGSYIDAYFAGVGSLALFSHNHPEIFNSRTGALKAQYQRAEKAIERAERDELFMKFLSGEKQKIMTGELFGEQWKIMIDFYHDNEMIVDLKYMRDMQKVYKDGEYKPFIDAWGYDVQGFVYQQIVKANTGKELPFFLAVITKEEVPDIDIIHIPHWRLKSAGEMIKHYIGRFGSIKRGEEPPERCEKCDYCKETKELTRVTEYEELLEE